jgi:hypothetical protein
VRRKYYGNARLAGNLEMPANDGKAPLLACRNTGSPIYHPLKVNGWQPDGVAVKVTVVV